MRANPSTATFGANLEAGRRKKSEGSDAADSRTGSQLPDGQLLAHTGPRESRRRLPKDSGPGYRSHPARFSICQHNGFHGAMRSDGKLVAIFAEQLLRTSVGIKFGDRIADRRRGARAARG